MCCCFFCFCSSLSLKYYGHHKLYYGIRLHAVGTYALDMYTHTLIHSQTDLCHWISESLSSQTTIEFQFQQRVCSWVDESVCVCGKQSNWNPCVHGSIQLQCAIWNSAYTQTDTLPILCRQQARTTMRILHYDGLRDISLRNGWIFEPCTNHCSTLSLKSTEHFHSECLFDFRNWKTPFGKMPDFILLFILDSSQSGWSEEIKKYCSLSYEQFHFIRLLLTVNFDSSFERIAFNKFRISALAYESKIWFGEKIQ